MSESNLMPQLSLAPSAPEPEAAAPAESIQQSPAPVAPETAAP